MSNVQSPGLPSSFPTGPVEGRKEGRKEGRRVGEEGSWLVILYYVLMFKKNNVTLCFSLDLTIL